MIENQANYLVMIDGVELFMLFNNAINVNRL